MNEEIIFNQFEGYKFGDNYEWVALHDEEQHFNDNSTPQIKLCHQTLRVRANSKWSKLPRYLKEVMVAHEIGHRAGGHHNLNIDNPFYRMGFVIYGKVDNRELEADEYACKLLGYNTVREALKNILNMSHVSDMAKKEYLLRVEAITPIH